MVPANWRDTTLVLRDYSGGYAGGSVATMVELMRSLRDPAMRAMLDDPYSLSPDRPPSPDLGVQAGSAVAARRGHRTRTGGAVDRRLRHGALQHPLCAPLQCLAEWAYGRRFRYTRNDDHGLVPGVSVMAAMFNAAHCRRLPIRRRVPAVAPSGFARPDDPAARYRHTTKGARGHYRVETYTTTTDGTRYRGDDGPAADPGYGAPRCWPVSVRWRWWPTEIALRSARGTDAGLRDGRRTARPGCLPPE